MKVGTKVRYVKDGCIDWEGEDWAKDDGLTLEGIYTVMVDESDHDIPAISIAEGKYNHWIHPDHFEIVEE